MFRVLLIDVQANCRAVIESALTFAELIDGPPTLGELSESPLDPPPHLILCSKKNAEQKITEYAQDIKKIYPDVPSFYLTAEKTGFDRAQMIKSGFDDAFFLAFENAEFESKIHAIAGPQLEKERTFRSVKLFDLQPGAVLDFDTFLFLPMNRRYLKFSNANSAIRPEQFEKLKKHSVNSLFIKQSDSKKFYNYTARQLVELGKAEGLSETERQDRLEGAIRSIVSELFTDFTDSELKEEQRAEQGAQLMQDCTEIVKSYFEASTGKPLLLFDKLENVSGHGSSHYAHSANSATIASIFSIGLKIGNPEHLAMAGLLHDIGMAELPAEIQTKEESEMSGEEHLVYRTHPKLALDILEKNKMSVPDEVKKMILQHHENFDGTGFPDRIRGMALSSEAQLLAIADIFDDLTILKPGKKRVTPFEAIQAILRQNEEIKVDRTFDPMILSKLRRLLFESRPFM